MKVFADHFLDSAKRELIPGRGEAMLTRRLLVIHFTSGATALSSINYWRETRSLGAHLIIDRDGTIFQCRAFDRTCNHAGVSRWRDPKTGKLFRNVNSCAIGIELANAGDDARLAKRWSGLPLVRARHRNDRGTDPLSLWEQYPLAQLTACREAAAAIVKRYNLDDVTGHDCIAPERKNDPGPAFPMEALRETLGFQGLPTVFPA